MNRNFGCVVLGSVPNYQVLEVIFNHLIAHSLACIIEGNDGSAKESSWHEVGGLELQRKQNRSLFEQA